MLMQGGAMAGLEGRVFTQSAIHVTMNLDGAADSWGGVMIGKETVYGDTSN